MIALLLSACIPSLEEPIQRLDNDNSTPEVRVFADMILFNALTEIGKNYETSHPGSIIKLSFSSSKHLRELIEQGKAMDILVSAVPDDTAALIDEGHIRTVDTRKLSTSNLVVAIPSGNPKNIQSAEDLSQSGLKLGMMVDAKPLGKLTRTVLDNLNAVYGANYMNLVMANVTTNEEDAQAMLTKLASGEIDACIVDSFEVANMPDIAIKEIPATANALRYYDISILAKSPKHDKANDFINYVFSSEGLAVLTKWGFTVQ
jgi:molybdate transport system substrate-binding protein